MIYICCCANITSDMINTFSTEKSNVKCQRKICRITNESESQKKKNGGCSHRRWVPWPNTASYSSVWQDYRFGWQVTLTVAPHVIAVAPVSRWSNSRAELRLAWSIWLGFWVFVRMAFTRLDRKWGKGYMHFHGNWIIQKSNILHRVSV